MPIKVFKYLIFVLSAQCASIAAIANPCMDAVRQDSIRRVQVTIKAKEIPPIVDYNKLYQEASPLEVERKPIYGGKKTTAENTKPLLAVKPVQKSVHPKIKAIDRPMVEQPIKLASKNASYQVLTTKKEIVKQQPFIEKLVQVNAKKKTSTTLASARNETKADLKQKPTLSKIDVLSNQVKESSVLVKKDLKATDSKMPESEKEYNKSSSAEQARWDALADSQLRGVSDPVVEDNAIASKMSYLYIGFALTVIGVILGLVFGRPALLVSVVGVVFVVIGLFIRA